MKRIVMLLATATLSACTLNTTEVASVPSDPATETFASSLNINLSQMTKTADGVYYRDVVVGTGATLTGQPTILFRYGGFLKDGSVFGQGIVAAPGLALSGLIPGVQEGMQGMREGGERIIVIPSALGYGNLQGTPVPPNSTTIFDIRLDQIP